MTTPISSSTKVVISNVLREVYDKGRLTRYEWQQALDAVNSHDALIEALARLCADGQGIDPAKHLPTRADWEFAQAALALARGKETQ